MDNLTSLADFLERGGSPVVAALALIAVLVLYRSVGKLQEKLLGLVTSHAKALTSVEAVLQQVLVALTKDERTQEAAVRALAFSETAKTDLDKIKTSIELHAKETGEKLGILVQNNSK